MNRIQEPEEKPVVEVDTRDLPTNTLWQSVVAIFCSGDETLASVELVGYLEPRNPADPQSERYRYGKQLIAYNLQTAFSTRFDRSFDNIIILYPASDPHNQPVPENLSILLDFAERQAEANTDTITIGLTHHLDEPGRKPVQTTAVLRCPKGWAGDMGGLYQRQSVQALISAVTNVNVVSQITNFQTGDHNP